MELQSSFTFKPTDNGCALFVAYHGAAEEEHFLALILRRAGWWLVLHEHSAHCSPESVLSDPDPWVLAKTASEAEARVFALGWAMTNDFVLAPKVGETPSCRAAVTAFASGLQKGCDMIGPNGTTLVPLRFPQD